MSLHIVAKSILKLHLREPVVYLWNLAVPLLVFAVTEGRLLQGSIAIPADQIGFRLLPYIAYSIFMNCLFVGTHLVDWRESGYLRIITPSSAQMRKLAMGMIAATSLTNLLFVSIVIAFSFALGATTSASSIALLLAATPVFTLIFCCFSLFLPALPFGSKNLITVQSMFVWVLMVGAALGQGKLSQGDSSLAWWQLVNPVDLGRRTLSFLTAGHPLSPYDFAIAGLFLAVGIVSVQRINPNPVVTR